MGKDRSGRATGVARRFGHRATLLGVVVMGLLFPASALAAPETTIETGPADGSTIADATPTFTFDSPDPLATFECRIDSDMEADFTECTSPHTTAALTDGPHTFEVRAIDVLVQADPTPATRSFTVDTDPPDTTIDSGPSGPINDPTPSFTFSSDEPGSTFECRVDGAPAGFGPCEGPGDSHITDPLSDGPHSFEVRAIDPAGNPGDTETRSFTVDTGAPNTVLDGPSGPIDDATPTFDFSSTEADSTFECRIDAEDFAPCASPYSIAALSDGHHTFEVLAVDAASNRDPSPAQRNFTVDTIAPDATVDSGPVGPISDTTPTFTFSATDETPTTFHCSVDGAAFGPCSGPGQTHTSTPLADGHHSFQVRATDAAGNFSDAGWAFDIDTSGPPDTTPPDTTVTKKPKSRIKTKKKTAKVEVAFKSEPGAAYRCKLDKAKYEPCTSPYSVKARSKPGKGRKHEIAVRAIDSAGNVGEPVVVGFRVVRKLRLKESVAERTVARALQRHGFAKRVVRAVRANCSRRAYSAFSCKFSSNFPGYRLKGRGEVKLRAHLSYRFRVKAQGVRLTLTDRNESG